MNAQLLETVIQTLNERAEDEHDEHHSLWDE